MKVKIFHVLLVCAILMVGIVEGRRKHKWNPWSDMVHAGKKMFKIRRHGNGKNIWNWWKTSSGSSSSSESGSRSGSSESDSDSSSRSRERHHHRRGHGHWRKTHHGGHRHHNRD